MTPKELLLTALEEDKIHKDLTTEYFADSNIQAQAEIISRKKGVFSGLSIINAAKEVFEGELEFNIHLKEGDSLEDGTKVVTISGEAGHILKLERTLLNFISRLSGIATLTYAYALKITSTRAKLLDTRKTTPLLRSIEKQAVLAGGGVNHRLDLGDGVLIKENHILSLGGEEKLLQRLDQHVDLGLEIIVEVENLDFFKKVLERKPSVILLDNFTVDQIKEAVSIRNEFDPSKKTLLEASGGISLDNIVDYAEAGVDRISVGSIIHQATWHDFSLLFKGK
jgi:nicotinate-nucleotide pyrophosphorylase (carboxylating)